MTQSGDSKHVQLFLAIVALVVAVGAIAYNIVGSGPTPNQVNAAVAAWMSDPANADKIKGEKGDAGPRMGFGTPVKRDLDEGYEAKTGGIVTATVHTNPAIQDGRLAINIYIADSREALDAGTKTLLGADMLNDLVPGSGFVASVTAAIPAGKWWKASPSESVQVAQHEIYWVPLQMVPNQ